MCSSDLDCLTRSRIRHRLLAGDSPPAVRRRRQQAGLEVAFQLLLGDIGLHPTPAWSHVGLHVRIGERGRKVDPVVLGGMGGEIGSSETAAVTELTEEEDEVSDTAHSALLIYQRERKRRRRPARRYRWRGTRWLTRSPRNPTITVNGNNANAWTGGCHVDARKINRRNERLRREATRG